MTPRHLQIMLVLLLVAMTAMGIYTYRLRQRAEAHIQKAAAPMPVLPVGAGNAQEKRVTLVLASDATASLGPSSVAAQLPAEPTERARALLQLLLRAYQQPDSQHPLASTGDIDAVFLLKDGTAVVDLSDSFARTHPSGIMLESLTLDSIAQTLHANFPEVRRVHFLVAGKPQETLAGHASLSSDYPAYATN